MDKVFEVDCGSKMNSRYLIVGKHRSTGDGRTRAMSLSNAIRTNERVFAQRQEVYNEEKKRRRREKGGLEVLLLFICLGDVETEGR